MQTYASAEKISAPPFAEIGFPVADLWPFNEENAAPAE